MSSLVVWRGLAGHGPARRGMARANDFSILQAFSRGVARLGPARLGVAMPGMAWSGAARSGEARATHKRFLDSLPLFSRGMARLGAAWPGIAGCGVARQGKPINQRK